MSKSKVRIEENIENNQGQDQPPAGLVKLTRFSTGQTCLEVFWIHMTGARTNHKNQT